jgi:hypothetical protein
MAQPPQPPHKPAAPPPPAAKPPPPLKDPAEGKSPAIGGGHLTRQADARAEELPPDPPVKTVGDEQRERSAYIESIGVEAYKDEIDERDDEERAAHPAIAKVEGAKLEHHAEGAKK